jgi:hypothetical protein
MPGCTGLPRGTHRWPVPSFWPRSGALRCDVYDRRRLQSRFDLCAPRGRSGGLPLPHALRADRHAGHGFFGRGTGTGLGGRLSRRAGPGTAACARALRRPPQVSGTPDGRIENVPPRACVPAGQRSATRLRRQPQRRRLPERGRSAGQRSATRLRRLVDDTRAQAHRSVRARRRPGCAPFLGKPRAIEACIAVRSTTCRRKSFRETHDDRWGARARTSATWSRAAS